MTEASAQLANPALLRLDSLSVQYKLPAGAF